MPRSLIPVMTPHGSLRLDQANDDFVLESRLADRLEKSFERGSGHCLLHLGTSEAGSVLPASLAGWRDFGMRFIADLCALGDAKGAAGRPELAAPTSSELAALIDDAPPMRRRIPAARRAGAALGRDRAGSGGRTHRKRTLPQRVLESPRQSVAIGYMSRATPRKARGEAGWPGS